MGYDYSLGFLARHHETVQVIINISQTGSVVSFDSETWEPIRQRHQLIRSLLANMEKNMEGYGDIRRRIRTWTEHTPGGFRLNVGVPLHRVTGRPPAPASIEWRKQYVSASMVGEAHRHDEIVHDAAGMQRLLGVLMILPSNQGHVEVRIHELSQEYLNTEFLPFSVANNWRVEKAVGDRFTLVRIKAQPDHLGPATVVGTRSDALTWPTVVDSAEAYGDLIEGLPKIVEDKLEAVFARWDEEMASHIEALGWVLESKDDNRILLRRIE